MNSSIVALADGCKEFIRAEGEAFDDVDLITEDHNRLFDLCEGDLSDGAEPALDGTDSLVVHPVIF